MKKLIQGREKLLQLILKDMLPLHRYLIGPTVSEDCLGSNIPAPSRNAMYYSVGKVCKDIERINRADMKML